MENRSKCGTESTASRPPPSRRVYLRSFPGFVFLVPGISILAALGPILALTFGYQARKRIKLSGRRIRGRALARAGIALGFAELGVYLLFFLFILHYLRMGALFCDGQSLP